MNVEIKDRWIKALRSGKYLQTSGKLMDQNGFCYLGVLCDLYLQEKRLEWTIDKGSYNYSGHGKGFPLNSRGIKVETRYLPAVVREWAGLEDAIELISKLMVLNDQGVSFKKIAKIIEEEA